MHWPGSRLQHPTRQCVVSGRRPSTMSNWTRKIAAAWLLCGLAAIPALAQGLTDKNPPSTAQVEIRANQAFNRGEYATALPLFQKLADTFKDQPTRLGSIQEKIRVCEKAIEVAKKEK